MAGAVVAKTTVEASRVALGRMASEEKRAVWYGNSGHVLFWDYEREAIAPEVLAFLEQFGE